MSFIWVFGFFFTLDRLAEIAADLRRSAPDARAWRAVAKGTRHWMLGGLFAPIGWLFMTESFLVPESTLGRAVVVLGAAVALLGAVFFLYGASSLMTARELFRDARRLKDEIRP